MARVPPVQHAVHIVLVGIYLWHASRFGDWLVDDAGITFGYAKHLAEGVGPVINAGEAPVEGYSNPAWTFLCAALYKLGLFAIPTTPKLLGPACVVAAMVVVPAWTRRWLAPPEAPEHLLPPLAMALSTSFVQYSVSGLENPSFALSVLGMLALALPARGLMRAGAAGLCAFAVAIGRPEGVVYVAAAGAGVLVHAIRTRRWPELFAFAAAFVLPAAAYAGWHAVTFADPFPNTYYAKVHQSRTLLDMLDLHDKGNAYVRGFFRAQWLEVWAVVAAMAWLAPRWLVTSPLLAVQLALAGGLFAGLQSGGDWMDGHRLLTTLYPLLAVAAAAGIRELRARLGGSVAAVALAGIGSALVMTTPMLTERTVGRLGMRLEVQLRSLEPFTRWADALHLERPVVVAMGAMGGASLTTTPDFRLIDVFGLTTREVARRLYTLESTGPEPLWAWLFDEQRPHFLEYPETIRRRWDLDQCTRCRAAYLLIETRENDPEARVGTFVRRDLVSDEPPADLAWTGCEDGPAAAVEVRDGRATLWWRGPFTRAPTGQLRWIGAEGATLATGPVKAFDGAFSWLLYAQRAVIREQRAAPAGALDATFTRVSGTDDCRAAQAALDGLPLVAGGDFEPGGEQWSAVPPGDLAFGAGFEGRAVAVSQVGRASWACGPYSPVTGPQRVSVRVRGEGLVNAERGVATAGVAVRARRASGKWRTVMLSKVDGSFDWMRVSATWKPREDDRKWAVCVGGGAASGTLYADEVRAGQAP